jgi:hypothetical protein
VLLRRPRRRTPGIQPTVIALAEDAITEWQVFGARLNTIAHVMNAHDTLPPGDLGPLLAQLRDLFTTSFALIPDDSGGIVYVLAPAARHHLRKVAVNLAPIRRRFEQLGLQTPNLLVRLLERARGILNADQAPHAP